MEAILSGTAGLGLILDGENAWVIRREEPDRPVATTSAQGRRLFWGREGGLRRFVVESISEGYRLLKGQYNKAVGLQLFFLALDEDLSQGVRSKIIALLEESLEDKAVYAYVQGVLYSSPLPNPASCQSLLQLVCELGNSHMEPLLRSLLADQQTIRMARASWDVYHFTHAPDEEPFALQTAVEAGLFYEFVRAYHSGKTDIFRFNALKLLHEYADHRELVQSWCHPLPRPAHTRPTLVAEQKERNKERTDRDKKKGGVDRSKTFGNVTQIKKQIVALFQKRPLETTKVDLLLGGLAHLQANKSNNKLLSRSLTDLAVKAREAGLADYQLRLANQAVEANETDGAAWSVLATALRAHGRFQEALSAAQQSIDYGNVPYGKCEKAATLLEMNRSSEALFEYEWVIREFPGEVVPRTGRAEALKGMNRLEDALQAYDEVIRDFPRDVIARNGRAETLKGMNRLEDALQAYNEVIRDFPGNVVARNGRADTLKKMNRLEEALAAYRETRQLFVNNKVALTGQAGVLLAMGLVDEAYELLGSTGQPVSRDDWINYHISAGIHLHRGELLEAEKMFRYGLENAPPYEIDYFKSGLAATHMRLRKYDQAEQELSTLNAPQWQPSVLLMRAHMQGLQGNRSQVAELLERYEHLGKVACNGYYIELSRHFREQLPMNDDHLFEQGVSCLALVA
ncbi:MAG: tetratricopeptide repeat protein [Magnetococcales bacterium]|nr:tetratricopeptide repeat protein [Magnetococcales bacterium]